MATTRNLILVLGDQLNLDSAAFADADPACDVVVMAEVESEVRRHKNHIQRVALFFSAMRNFRQRAESAGFRVAYQEVDDHEAAASLPCFLQRAIEAWEPEQVVMVTPGRFDLETALAEAAAESSTPIEVRPDGHFLCDEARFAKWADGRKTMVLEHFYRMMRRSTGYLMDDGQPEGGDWNFDADNRASFDADGPPSIPSTPSLEYDESTQGVFGVLTEQFPDLWGSLEDFAWPVSPDHAAQVLDDFIAHRLPHFGTYQDAMWSGQPFLFHARLAAALNLKLIDPRVVVERAIEAYHQGHAPINAVEGFVRQIIGWREFIRGVYRYQGPSYADLNALEATRPLPDFFWTGDTDMACLHEVVEQLRAHAYAHHIQRLMVAGLFTLLLGVDPKQVHAWFMALYIDSVEWVTLPNTVGMSQYADGGIVGTKPYIASGKYIQRMSNYCDGCRYDPGKATGDEACPFTTLYWDFLDRHEERLENNRRMVFQVRNLQRKSDDERDAIRSKADALRSQLAPTSA